MGAPTKFTPEIRSRILGLLREGNYRYAVARACGIDRDTLREWIKADPDFSGAVLDAEGEAEFNALRAVLAAAAADPAHARWYLERKFPQRWGSKQRHEVTGKGGGALTIQFRWPDEREHGGDDGDGGAAPADPAPAAG